MPSVTLLSVCKPLDSMHTGHSDLVHEALVFSWGGEGTRALSSPAAGSLSNSMRDWQLLWQDGQCTKTFRAVNIWRQMTRMQTVCFLNLCIRMHAALNSDSLFFLWQHEGVYETPYIFLVWLQQSAKHRLCLIYCIPGFLARTFTDLNQEALTAESFQVHT